MLLVRATGIDREVMVGSTVSRVEISHHPDFAVGDWVLSQNGWQEYAVSDGKDLQPWRADGTSFVCSRRTRNARFTAYMGLLEIGQPEAGKR